MWGGVTRARLGTKNVLGVGSPGCKAKAVPGGPSGEKASSLTEEARGAVSKQLALLERMKEDLF